MSLYSYYDNLFERLKISLHSRVSELVVSDDYQFFNRYATNDNNKVRKIQTGGNELRQINYEYGGYTFIVHQENEGDRITFSIHDEDIEENPKKCMILFIPRDEGKDEGFVYIENISYFDNCAKNGMPKTRGGSLLLQMTLNLIENILKNKYNLKYIQLKDNSLMPCKSVKKMIDLDSMYMLTRGDTWYGKYGFRPFDTNTNSLDLKTFIDYKTNQQLVKLIPLGCTKIKKYFLRAVGELQLQKIFPNKLINVMFQNYNDLPISKFFRDLLKRYEQTCGIFSLIYQDIMRDLHIVDLHGKTYYKPL